MEEEGDVMPAKKTIRKAQKSKSTPDAKEKIEQRNEFYCTRCGKRFQSQRNNFLRVQSPLWEQNDRYLPVCMNCTDELFEHYVEVLGSIQSGMRRMCLHFDIFYDSNLLENTVKGTHKNLFRAYIAKTYLLHVQGKTYDDTLDVEAGVPFEKPNEFESISITAKPKLPSQRQIEEWGDGFTYAELFIMDKHYRDLSQYVKNDNPIKDILIRDLCRIRIQQERMIKEGDNAQYEKLTKLYQSTLANPALSTDDEQSTGSKDVFGQWIDEIEHYAPADYYADKNKYWDFFGIGEYINRHMFRPLKNLLLGSRDRDSEYVVGDDDAG